MSDKIFVDTNILVYAHDIDAGMKQKTAKRIISELWESRSGLLSTQVIQEFYVTLTRKIPKPLKRAAARGIIRTYFSWEVIIIEPSQILHAIEIEDRYKLSFWDALVVSTAFAGNTGTIVTEDLNHGQIIEGVRIVNPFL